METHTEIDAGTGLFHPLAGWEAAARWNRATFDWMAKGWQQWVALMTTVPPQFVTPPTLTPEASQRVAEQVRAAQALDTQLRTREPATTMRAMARAEPRRASTKAAPRKKAKKASTRG